MLTQCESCSSLSFCSQRVVSCKPGAKWNKNFIEMYVNVDFFCLVGFFIVFKAIVRNTMFWT